MTIRDEIAVVVDGWIKHARGETYLDPVHPKARLWLIERLETFMLEKGMGASAASKKGGKR